MIGIVTGRDVCTGAGVALIIVLVAIFAAANESSASTRGCQLNSVSQEPDSQPATPNYFDRASLPLPKALLGHWLSESKQNHMYFSIGKYISVFGGRVHQGTYAIDSVNEQESTLRIIITQIHARTFTFSPNRKEISDIVEIAGTKATEPVKWQFMGPEQVPSGEVVKSTSKDDVLLSIVTAPPPEMSLIVGNAKTRLYYAPGCSEYDRVPNKNRVYFKTRKAAARAGYRAAKGCS